jgi:hypothetical protein
LERLIKIGDALSQLGNVAWPFWSHRDTSANESISGRCYREGRPFRHVINALFFWQDDHCRAAYETDLARARDTVAQYEGDT